MVDNIAKDKLDEFISSLNKKLWKTFKFSEIAENIVEKVTPKDSVLKHYIGLDQLDAGSIEIKRFADPTSLVGDKLKIYKGDILVGKRNAYLKRASRAPFDAIASAHSFVLRAKENVISPELFPFFMLSEAFWETAIRISVGSLSPTINWKSLATQEFLIPPKEQQIKLADLFWSANNSIETRSLLLIEIQRFKKNYQLKLLDGSTKIIRSNKFQPSINNSIILKGWKKQKIKDVATVVRGSTPRPAGSPIYFNGDYLPWVTVGTISSVKNVYIQLDKVESKLTLEGAKFTRIVRPNTVLLSNSGYSLGVPAILTFEAGINDGVAAFLDLKEIDEMYLFYFLQSKTELFRTAIAAGADQPNLNTTRIGDLDINLPSLEEQRIIAKELRGLDQKIELLENDLNKIKSILHLLINAVS